MCYTVCILKRKIGDALCMFTKAPESFYVVRLFGVETCPFAFTRVTLTDTASELPT